jgi:tetratricopeptide (TPR) repeat protein
VEDIRIAKVDILIQQKKYVEAERILKDLLATDANNIQYLALLVEVNLQQDKLDVAKSIINNAIGMSPDTPILFSIKARVLLQEEDYKQAESDIRHAIALDPYDADYFAILAHIRLGRKNYEEALTFANKALEIDAENLLALNTRSTALLKLNRSEESFSTVEGALREDPNNAYTHANYGWGLLEKGNHKKALEHFREALKNDPNFDYAQAGMIEALKASNPVYRSFLKYAFWMSNLTSKYQWGVILGFYFGTKLLRNAAEANPRLQPFLVPLIILLSLVAFSTWIIEPISNLFLRFNRYGQFLLSKQEKMSSNFVAVSLLVCLTGVVLYFIQDQEKFLAVGAYGLGMMVPLSAMFSRTKKKNILLIYAIAMGVVGALAVSVSLTSGELFNSFSGIFLFGFMAFQWIANYMVIEGKKR